MKLKDIIPPVKIEWTRHRDNRGSLMRQATIVDKGGRNLKTDEGDYLWWPTINHYGDVRIVAEEEKAEAKE